MEPRVAALRVSEIARNKEMYLAPYNVNTGIEVK
jgi:hypothetical protein